MSTHDGGVATPPLPYAVRLGGIVQSRHISAYWAVYIVLAMDAGEIWYTGDDGVEHPVWRNSDTASTTASGCDIVTNRIAQIGGAA